MQARWATVPLRTRLTLIGVIGAAGAAGVAYLTSRNPFAQPAQLAVITRVVLALSLVLAGIYAETNRLQARMGRGLIAAGIFSVAWLLNGSAESIAFTIGALSAGAAPIVFCTLLLSHPQGRLPSAAHRRLVRAGWCALAPLWLMLMCVSPRAPLGTPLMHCGAHCPENLLFVRTAPAAVVFGLRALTVGVWLTVTGATALLLIRRWRTAHPMLRSALGPIIPAAVAIPVLLAGYLVLERMGTSEYRLVGASYIFIAIVLPLTILTGLGRERMYVAGALTRFLNALTQSPTAAPEALMASAVGDPTLQIAYHRASRDTYVSLEGTELPLPAHSPGRHVTFIRRDQRPLAAVTYSAELRDHEAFVEAAAAIALMRLENARLEADLRASASDLHASRVRLVEATHEERRRIERDLHDTVQQQLVGLRIKLGFAADTVDADPDRAEGMLARLEADVDDVLATLRNLARGIYPPLLGERGIAAALSAVAQRLPFAVTVVGFNIGRHHEDVEVAVYFCCLEALQNVAKHAGNRAAASVRLWLADGRLCFEVRDDGTGFDAATIPAGNGLMNMRDRIETIGGTLHVRSRPGSGAAISGSAPAQLVVDTPAA